MHFACYLYKKYFSFAHFCYSFYAYSKYYHNLSHDWSFRQLISDIVYTLWKVKVLILSDLRKLKSLFPPPTSATLKVASELVREFAKIIQLRPNVTLLNWNIGFYSQIYFKKGKYPLKLDKNRHNSVTPSWPPKMAHCAALCDLIEPKYRFL